MASEVPFSQVRKMLEAKGYALGRIAGSHHVFVKDGFRSVPIPVHHNMVKAAYVRLIRKLEG